ncbi:hypothetical protein RND71_007097 [Anisodus tanguticus]|uniref:Transmembrane protein n=1 Tax=Anisodus tanguticus TaxID=243964 RepID=A0AAE1SIG0_9SOLA|nr:hypothetical protein RND71_007097 [Anisodus tanguticus]
MENTHRTLFLLTLVLFFSHFFMLSEGIKFQYSRRLMVSLNSVSTNIGKVNGAIVEHEKAVENGLRRRPKSAANPIQNKVHH